MDTIKSPRFWLGAMAIAALVVLAVLGQIAGDTAAAGVLGLAWGTQVSPKTGGAK